MCALVLYVKPNSPFCLSSLFPTLSLSLTSPSFSLLFPSPQSLIPFPLSLLFPSPRSLPLSLLLSYFLPLNLFPSPSFSLLFPSPQSLPFSLLLSYFLPLNLFPFSLLLSNRSSKKHKTAWSHQRARPLPLHISKTLLLYSVPSPHQCLPPLPPPAPTQP